MKKFLLIIFMILSLSTSVSAVEITAPEVPEVGRDLMPKETESFSEGLRSIIRDGIELIFPDFAEAARECLSVIACVLILSIVDSFSVKLKTISDLVGAVAIGAILLQGSHSLLILGAETISELSEYGKLLLPVMTSALAAEGAVNASTALYASTALFNTLLTTLIHKLMIPMIYVFLALAVSNAALGNDHLKRMRDMLKNTITWIIKTITGAFTAYLGLTGVISGTTDAVALKATKMTISGVVPVIGGILSNASETVLIGVGLVKNAAGIYGIFALLAVFLSPFLKISAHYLIFKLTGAICSIFASKATGELVNDFAAAMGLLLAMTGAICLLLMISTICFLRGVQI